MNNSSQNPSDPITLVDRFSNLPDEILCPILSLVNTKQAVATSILSKRWQFLWTYVDTLDLNLDIGFKFEEMNRTLQCLRGLIKRMSIATDRHVVPYIQTVVSKKVEILRLHFGDGLYEWPICLFDSQTLVELKLEYAHITLTGCTVSPAAAFFPNLKKLSLYRPICRTDSLNRFISGCSILEYFNLDCSKEYRVEEERYISSATLKHFQYTSDINERMIILDTPALEVLETQNTDYLDLLVESSMPSLHKAQIPIRLYRLDSSLRFLECLSNVSVLRCEVHGGSFERRRMNLHAHFNNLTRLEIVGHHQFELDLLSIVMEKSNNLKAVTLKNKFFMRSGIIWEEPQHVPECFLSSLESVRISGYPNMEEGEVESMIKYILGNAKVLKRMEIRFQTISKFLMSRPDLYKAYKKFIVRILHNISLFPRASVKCEISFN